MIAGAVEMFDGIKPGRAELRRIMNQSGPTLKALVRNATAPGTCTLTDGWAGYEGLENHKAVVGDAPAHEVLDWIHRVFSNPKRWGLGVLRENPDWQLIELSFRWKWRHRRGENLFARLGPGANRSGRQPCTGLRVSAPKRGQILRNRAKSRAKRPNSDQLNRNREPKACIRRDSTCCTCGLKAISHPRK